MMSDRNIKGMSLIELLIALMVGSLVVLTVLELFNSAVLKTTSLNAITRQHALNVQPVRDLFTTVSTFRYAVYDNPNAALTDAADARKASGQAVRFTRADGQWFMLYYKEENHALYVAPGADVSSTRWQFVISSGLKSCYFDTSAGYLVCQLSFNPRLALHSRQEAELLINARTEDAADVIDYFITLEPTF